MNLLLVRHALAVDRAEVESDDLRPLTEEGAKKMRKAARGLRLAMPSIELLTTSPLVRAVATAAIVEAAYADEGRPPLVRETELLRPGADRAELLDWLALEISDPIALVGHEPDLSELLAALVGAERPFHRFRKGGAAAVSFPGRVEEGAGSLLWALSPALLRALGNGKKASPR